MFRILRFLLIGKWSLCNHRWVVKNESQLVDMRDKDIAIGKIFDMQCSQCGDIKRKIFRNK